MKGGNGEKYDRHRSFRSRLIIVKKYKNGIYNFST